MASNNYKYTENPAPHAGYGYAENPNVGYTENVNAHTLGGTNTTARNTGNPMTGTKKNVVTGHDDPAGTHGPHRSKIANILDPRVDSDRDHRAAPTAGAVHSHAPAPAAPGSHHPTTTTGYDDPAGTHGPHHSKFANAADPRVDSDRDHRGAPPAGAVPPAAPASYGHTATTGYNDPAGTHGPHHSRMANAADPRVDSDRDHRGAPIHGAPASYGHTATTGYDDPAGTHGPHHSRLANVADPRVDSDRDHRAAPPAGVVPQAAPASHHPTTTTAPTAAPGGPTTTHYTTTTTTTTTPAGTSTHRQGGGVKGAMAQGHGIGETVRGRFNAAMDGLLGDHQGKQKNEAIAAGGEREIANKDFERKGTLNKTL